MFNHFMMVKWRDELSKILLSYPLHKFDELWLNLEIPESIVWLSWLSEVWRWRVVLHRFWQFLCCGDQVLENIEDLDSWSLPRLHREQEHGRQACQDPLLSHWWPSHDELFFSCPHQSTSYPLDCLEADSLYEWSKLEFPWILLVKTTLFSMNKLSLFFLRRLMTTLSSAPCHSVSPEKCSNL